MEKLKQSQEILSLGKKLVKEFSEDQRCKMTTRWMSHYLAECMTRTEHEKNPTRKAKLEKDCCEVILQLWKSRKNFPGRTRPLSNLADAMDVLSALVQKDRDIESWSNYIDERHLIGWGKFTKELLNHFNELLAISLCATVSADALKKEKKWLKHKELLSDEEREIIERLDHLLNKTRTYQQIMVVFEGPVKKKEKNAPSQSRLEKVFEKLQEHIDDLGKQLEALRNEKQKSKPKKVVK